MSTSGSVFSPRLTHFYPANESTTASLTSVYIDMYWSLEMETTQFSDAAERAKRVQVRDEETGDILETEYVSYSSPTRHVRLEITETLIANRRYRVTVFAGAEDLTGRKSTVSIPFIFTAVSSGLDLPEIVLPPNESVQSMFPIIQWDNYPETVQLQLADDSQFNSLVVNTTASGGYYSYSGSPDVDSTYYIRVRAVSGTASGEWTPTTQFYYGSEATVHPSSRVSGNNDGFYIITSSIDDETNLSAWPTIYFQFNKAIDDSMLGNLTAYYQAVLLRNDDATTRSTTSLPGSWTATGNFVYFTPSDAIAGNTRYTFRFPLGFGADDGDYLLERYEKSFTGLYTPYYCDFNIVKGLIRSEADIVTPDFINWSIHLASLEANALYHSDQLGLEAVFVPGMMSELDVRSPDLKTHGVMRWTALTAAIRILEGVWADEVRAIGRSVRLADYQESLNKDFFESIKDLIGEYKKEKEYWESTLVENFDAMGISKSVYFDPLSWRYQFPTYRTEGPRINVGL